jgi:hypothetical protein
MILTMVSCQGKVFFPDYEARCPKEALGFRFIYKVISRMPEVPMMPGIDERQAEAIQADSIISFLTSPSILC